MVRDEFRNLFILGKDVNHICDAIPSEVIRFVLWRGFSGKKISYSWQRSHEEIPLFQAFGAKHIPIIDFAFQTSLKLKIRQSQPEDIDRFTIQDLPNGSLIFDESLVQYNGSGPSLFKGFYIAFSQSIRNSVAHGIFGAFEDSALFCDGQNAISFVLKIKRSSVANLFRKWMSFSAQLLESQTAPSVIGECLRRLGYTPTISNDTVCLRDDKKPDWLVSIPAHSLLTFGNDRDRRRLARDLMEKNGRSLIVFPMVRATEPIGRNYLYIDEWHSLAKSKKTPRAILNILRRVGYER
ncbi:MAG: hypothetical protein J6O18_05955 [Bacilli bacterium]|nr:hypothetical protein [Bacilli bacterium]